LQPEGGGKAMPVKFSFVVMRPVVMSPRLPPAQAPSTRRGTVLALDGTPLAEGFYRLTLPDGHRVQVEKLDFEWHILAPP
jgi:hypothetical protein